MYGNPKKGGTSGKKRARGPETLAEATQRRQRELAGCAVKKKNHIWPSQPIFCMTEPVPRGGCRTCAFTPPAGHAPCGVGGKQDTGAESWFFVRGHAGGGGGGVKDV